MYDFIRCRSATPSPWMISAMLRTCIFIWHRLNLMVSESVQLQILISFSITNSSPSLCSGRMTCSSFLSTTFSLETNRHSPLNQQPIRSKPQVSKGIPASKCLDTDLQLCFVPQEIPLGVGMSREECRRVVTVW